MRIPFHGYCSAVIVLSAHGADALAAASEAAGRGDPIDCICTLAEEAMAALDETDGRSVDSAIVDEIFKRFCVGK